MTEMTPTSETNLDRYGSPPLTWDRARERLEQAHTHWLATVRPDGRPHVAAVGVVWLDGAFYFTAGAETRKAKNLAQNPHAVITLAAQGIDLVLEGEATRVTDRPTLERAAARYRDGGWPAEVEGDAFTAPYSAPSAGPPPWDLYKFTPETVFGVATAEPYGATRWRF